MKETQSPSNVKQKIKPKSKQRLSKAKKVDGKAAEDRHENWYCFMCEEDIEETMICCRACHQWVHVACAGVDDDLFVCETCKPEFNN